MIRSAATCACSRSCTTPSRSTRARGCPIHRTPTTRSWPSASRSATGCPKRIADTLALHDAPYWVWHRRGGDRDLLEQVLSWTPDRELLRRFVELDASTLGKDPAFLEWFRAATAEPASKDGDGARVNRP